MAFSDEKREDIEVLNKNNRGDKIIIAKITNQRSGSVSVDVRNYYTDDDDNVLPTKKGIRINSEILPEVIKAMMKVMEPDELEDIIEEMTGLEEGSDTID